VRGVKPIKHDRAEPANPRPTARSWPSLRQAATVRTDNTTVRRLSDQFVIDVGPKTS
jgi:hypothetical protein